MDNDKEQVSYKLEGTLDISGVHALKTELAGLLESGKPMVLVAADLERVDGAALQLLCAFRQAAEVAGVPLRWDGVSRALNEAAALTGLTAALGLAEAS